MLRSKVNRRVTAGMRAASCVCLVACVLHAFVSFTVRQGFDWKIARTVHVFLAFDYKIPGVNCSV